MHYILGITRLLLFALILSVYIFVLFIITLFIPKGKKEQFGLAYRGTMARTLFPVLGIKVHKSGIVPQGPALVVSNHRSYIDPAPVAAYAPILPIAKMEIGKWPLVGIGVKLTGILLVQRNSIKSRSTIVQAMKNAWAENKIILNYPEGTTHDKRQTQPFSKGAFVAAVSQHIPIVPFCIEYRHRGDAWIGDDTFIPHFIRCFGKWRTDIYIEFGHPLKNIDPDEAMNQSKVWIDERLRHYQQKIAK